MLRGGAQKRGKAEAAQKDAAPPPQVFRFPDGSMYRGGVLDGMQHGEGEWRSAEGDVYVGGFARGAFEGRGRYKDARGNVFIGDFRAGSYHGAGTYLYADGRAECSLYESGADRGEGARWSMDRARAWRLRDGRVVGEISLREGAAVCHAGLELRSSRLKIDLPLTRASQTGFYNGLHFREPSWPLCAPVVHPQDEPQAHTALCRPAALLRRLHVRQIASSQAS